MKLELANYVEGKPHRMKRLLWLMASKLLYVTSWSIRSSVFRWFGAKVANDCALYPAAKYYAPWNLECGSRVCIGPGAEIYNKAKVTIGSNVVISQGAYICTASHDISSPTMDLVLKPITIGSNVWIAAKATILPGVTIGEGAVVGACAVVAKDVPPWSVVVGNPARVVKKRELK